MGLLEIYIPTYNRSRQLDILLNELVNSDLIKYKITILNNNSTDNTIQIFSKYHKLNDNFHIITRKINIGAPANIVTASEFFSSEYIWFICDDDDYDFKGISRLINKIQTKRFDLIHLGAHDEIFKFAETYGTPKEFIKNGYNYFKNGSFLSCNIFRSQIFRLLLIEAYNNIQNSYPHVPYLKYIYENDLLLFLSNKKFLNCKVGNQYYNWKDWTLWWIQSAKNFNYKKDRSIFFFSHFGSQYSCFRQLILVLYKGPSINSIQIVEAIFSYFKLHEIFFFSIKYFLLELIFKKRFHL